MNIEIANKLVELRKKNGYSQEELAAKLGLSRQAISKWERAEASPDTDNLICLAKLYGVSLDELLKNDDDVETIVKEQMNSNEEKSNEISAEQKEENPRIKKLRIIEAIVSSILTLLVTIVYITLGCLFDATWPDPMVWKYLWVLYFIIPLFSSIYETIIFKKFECLNVAIVMSALIIFFTLGFFLDAWHPGWVVFLLIPTFAGIAGPIDKAISASKEKDK